eukprot:GHVR01085474.1.p1 GENE.GHVR01085474.1~~GHVR01085474.1.p1  ORF type:complete len:116 (+),score=82.59 GHVR01085474.1:46-348(+)
MMDSIRGKHNKSLPNLLDLTPESETTMSPMSTALGKDVCVLPPSHTHTHTHTHTRTHTHRHTHDTHTQIFTLETIYDILELYIINIYIYNISLIYIIIIL